MKGSSMLGTGAATGRVSTIGSTASLLTAALNITPTALITTAGEQCKADFVSTLPRASVTDSRSKAMYTTKERVRVSPQRRMLLPILRYWMARQDCPAGTSWLGGIVRKGKAEILSCKRITT